MISAKNASYVVTHSQPFEGSTIAGLVAVFLILNALPSYRAKDLVSKGH
jgi:hypothetical protein